MRIRTKSIAGAGLVLVAALAVAAAPVMAKSGSFTASTSPIQDTTLGEGLDLHGTATLTLQGSILTAEIRASGASPNLPHLMHIHGIIGGQNDCPNIVDDLEADTNFDGFLDNTEATPAYGPFVVTFTTTGSTSAGQALNLEAAVIAGPDGSIDYLRSFRIPSKIAKDLANLHIVIHGADLNGDRAYDADGFEAALPVSCGGIN